MTSESTAAETTGPSSTAKDEEASKDYDIKEGDDQVKDNYLLKDDQAIDPEK